MYNQALTRALAPFGFIPYRGGDFGAYQLEIGGLRLMLVAAADDSKPPTSLRDPILVAFGGDHVAEPALVLEFPTVMAFITAMKRGQGDDEPPRPRLRLVPKP
jgi:hypothetical protein